MRPRLSNYILPEVRGSGLQLICTPCYGNRTNRAFKLAGKWRTSSLQVQVWSLIIKPAWDKCYVAAAIVAISLSKRFGHTSCSEPCQFQAFKHMVFNFHHGGEKNRWPAVSSKNTWQHSLGLAAMCSLATFGEPPQLLRWSPFQEASCYMCQHFQIPPYCGCWHGDKVGIHHHQARNGSALGIWHWALGQHYGTFQTLFWLKLTAVPLFQLCLTDWLSWPLLFPFIQHCYISIKNHNFLPG